MRVSQSYLGTEEKNTNVNDKNHQQHSSCQLKEVAKREMLFLFTPWMMFTDAMEDQGVLLCITQPGI